MLALALPLIAYGVAVSIPLALAGVVVLVAAAFGWALEPSVAPADRLTPRPGASA